MQSHCSLLTRLLSVYVILTALSLHPAFAQTAGARLEGILRDASQAVIPGVTVTATNEGTNISHTSLSNDAGLYVFVNLPPGTYTLTSELQGFKRYVNKGIVVRVGDTLTINIALETGDIATEVVVSAAAPLIDVTSGKIGSVVQEKQVLDLPLNGRNPMMLFYLQAGTNPRDSLSDSGPFMQQAIGSVDGLRTNASNVKVEGVWANEPSYDMSPALPAIPVPQESVGEYRVTTSSASADAGRGSGAQVQVVYRSGTNNLHGSVYEFNRNTAYNANDFFNNRAGAARPVFLRNQYGAALGGPIRKNKAFFFVNWEGQRQIQGIIENVTVFTQPVRNGIFRYNTAGQNSPNNVDANGNPLVPFKTIDLLSVDPTRLGFDSSGIVAGKLKQIPPPNNYDLGDGFNLGGYRYTSSNYLNYNEVVAKFDYIVSKNHSVTVSYGDAWLPEGDDMTISGYRLNLLKTWRRFGAIGMISSLTPTLTNELRIGAIRWRADIIRPDPATYDRKGNFQLMSLGTGRGLGTNGNPLTVYLDQRNPVSGFNINENVSWVKGNHTFKFGFEWSHAYNNTHSGSDEWIPVVYPSTATNPANVPALAGLAAADRTRAQQLVNDLTGTIGNINQTYNANSVTVGFLPYDTRSRQVNQKMYGSFFQDTWKTASNLTINFGLRWDLLPPGYMKDGILSYPKGGSKGVLGISGPLGITEFTLARLS